NSWKQHEHVPREERLAETLAESGASITLTTATDILAFGIGYFYCSAPAMNIFCIFTAVARVLNFVYQLTFFAAVMVHGDSPNYCCCCQKRFQLQAKLSSLWPANYFSGSRISSESSFQSFLSRKFASKPLSITRKLSKAYGSLMRSKC